MDANSASGSLCKTGCYGNLYLRMWIDTMPYGNYYKGATDWGYAPGNVIAIMYGFPRFSEG